MKFYEATADIDAPAEAVWAILTDAPGLSRWDSGVTSVEGSIAPGQRIKVHVAANPGRAFPVRVTDFEPPRRMVWSGGMPLGLFRGVRTFTIDRSGEATVRFTMREEYTGLLLGLIWRSIPDLGSSFEQFAHGLKAQAEARVAATS